jgi:archaellum biogenesis ATPase FlaH
MCPLFNNSTASKIWFDHAKFKEDNHITKAKDFSDYLEQFETLKDFQVAMDHFIASQKVQSHGWENAINKITKPITHEAIKAAANMDWLIDNALIKNNITTLVGAPNVGKSAFSFAIVNKLFAEDKIDKLLYFDADNPISYVKDRIIKLIDTHGEDKVNYYNGLNSSAKEMNEVLEVLSNVRNGGDRTIIIIDSLKFFINGSMNEDKLVSPFFDMLKAIRDRFGATILCLHHTRKSKDDEGKLTYNGSQVVEASTDNMVMLTKEFIYHKKSRSDRAGLKFEISLNFEEMSFNLSDAVEENDDEESEKDDKTQIYADKIYDYLIEKNESVKQTQITEDLKDFVPRRKVKEILWLDKYKNNLWNFTKGEGKTWLFTAIRKFGSVEVVEYDCDIDVDSMVLF